MREPTLQDGRPILRDVLALEASGEGIGDERVVDVPVHDRVGIEPQPVGARANAGQVAHCVDECGAYGPPWGMLTLTVLALMEAR